MAEEQKKQRTPYTYRIPAAIMRRLRALQVQRSMEAGGQPMSMQVVLSEVIVAGLDALSSNGQENA